MLPMHKEYIWYVDEAKRLLEQAQEKSLRRFCQNDYCYTADLSSEKQTARTHTKNQRR